MSCGGCGKSGQGGTSTTLRPKVSKRINMDAIVEKSKNPDVKIPLLYYGGGFAKRSSISGGCSSCKGGSSVARVTSETIIFASEDAPYGIYKQLFEAGRTYYVTENQAKYLLSLTFVNQAGQTVNKFKRLETEKA